MVFFPSDVDFGGVSPAARRRDQNYDRDPNPRGKESTLYLYTNTLVLKCDANMRPHMIA